MRHAAAALSLLLLLLAAAAPAGANEGLLDDIVFFDTLLGEEIPMGPVDTDTVRGFEILYATPGAGDVSEIAGHLLLRVMLNNNPRAEARGLENPNDLVISFLADTESGRPARPRRPAVVQEDCRRINWLNLVNENPGDESPLASIWQSLKGLSGGFRIIMDRQTLGHALKSYTVTQDRALLRYRLNLTPEQKASLLARLREVRLTYTPPYYFFSQNCGSVLIEVIGQGIGDPDIARFHPLVAPPHSLLGNLVRRGLATRVTPAFYSYRQQGFIAERLLRRHYATLVRQLPALAWPPAGDLTDRREEVRAQAITDAGALGEAHPELRPGLYRLAALAQEADMATSHKDRVCENYTSAAAAAARALQARLLAGSNAVETLAVDTGLLIRGAQAAEEAAGAADGALHTGLYTLSAGVGRYRSARTADGPVVIAGGALLRQDMGDPSRLAMQRAGSVELGGGAVVLGDDRLKEWQLTGLRLRKFRETLETVPSCLVSTRGLGLGLSVLELRQADGAAHPRGTVAGAAVLGNLVSSARHKDFLYVSAGADLAMDYDTDEPRLHPEAPLGLESLCTWGRDMACQWRNSATWSFSPDSGPRPDFRGTTMLLSHVGELGGSGVWLGVAADYRREYEGKGHPHAEETLLTSAFVTIARW